MVIHEKYRKIHYFYYFCGYQRKEDSKQEILIERS